MINMNSYTGTSIWNNKKLLFNLWFLFFSRTLRKFLAGLIYSLCVCLCPLVCHWHTADLQLPYWEHTGQVIRRNLSNCEYSSSYLIWWLKNPPFVHYIDKQIKMAWMIQLAIEVKWRSKYSEMSFEGGAEKNIVIF